MKTNHALSTLDRTLGVWTVTGTHPLLPGRSIGGRVRFEAIDGGAFVRMHSKMDDPAFPEGIAIFGADDDAQRCTMLYFDSRDVARIYDVTLRADGFTWSRDTPKFAQRFHVTIAPDGSTMRSEGTMKRDGGDWEPDLSLSYVRQA